MGNLTTPKSVQKLQMALHAKAKAEAGYRFYASRRKMIPLVSTALGCMNLSGLLMERFRAPGLDGDPLLLAS